MTAIKNSKNINFSLKNTYLKTLYILEIISLKQLHCIHETIMFKSCVEQTKELNYAYNQKMYSVFHKQMTYIATGVLYRLI